MTQRINKIIMSSLLLMFTAGAQAQLLSVNDAKTKLEGSVEYHSGTPIAENPDGKVRTHEALWHNFVFSPLQKLGVELHHVSNDGGDNASNHYFRFGVNGMKVFMLPGNTRGVAVTANLYGEGSKYGVHHFDGVLSTLMMFSMKPNDSRGVGFIFLVNNPSKMFALPIFTWKRDFDKHWSINWMTWLGDFSYNFNDKAQLTASYGFGFDRHWIDYEGNTCMYNQIVATPALSFQYKATKNLSLSLSGGYQIGFMGSLFNECGKKYIKKMDSRSSTFCQGKVYYRF